LSSQTCGNQWPRVSTGGKRLEGFKTLKQVGLARNLIVCITSSHLYPTFQALMRKSREPTTCGPESIATVRDVRRLGAADAITLNGPLRWQDFSH
jgi:DNA-binding LacI/PurR family transcriptional regulator